MYHLRLLGSVYIEGDEGVVSGPPAQRHRLALLALLADAHPGGVAREKLMALLWPESDTARARNLLNQSVYALRKALGDDAIRSVADELRLDGARVGSDVTAFREALKAGEARRMVDVYTGPFLDGFGLPRAYAFEEWAEGVREELQRKYRGALRDLAQTAETAGRSGEAVDWWHRLAVSDPYDAHVTRQLMQGLERIGNRVEAIRTGLEHAERLREEFDAEPHPGVMELVERIRASPTRSSPMDEGGGFRGETGMKDPAPAHDPAMTPNVADGAEGAVATGRPRRWRPWLRTALILAFLVPAVAGLVAVWSPFQGVPWSSHTGSPPSVAVLPFVNMGPDQEGGYFGVGVAEELIGVLSRIEGLEVVPRTSSFAMDGTGLGAREIGGRLGVTNIVEGSVRRSGGRLRVQATVVNVDDGYPLWSGRFDARDSDIFAVQDSIAHAVAEALAVRLREDPPSLASRGGTRDFRAQDLYFKGRFAWNRRTRAGLEEAVAHFDSAVALDSTYARALVGLGDAWAVLGFYDYHPPDVAFPQARRAALRALAIDSTLAEPHATLGYAALYHDWDWPGAEEHFRRAIGLDPGYPVAHQWYANLLTALGRFEEARAEMRRASELDPLSMIAFTAIGWVDLHAGEYDQAIRQLQEATERDPAFMLAHLFLGQSLEALGRFPEAEAAIRRAVALSGGSAISRTALARILGLQARAGEADTILARLHLEGEEGYVPAYEMARAHLGMADTAAALAWLEQAHRERAHSMVFLRVDPQLEVLRGHPRIREIMAEMGL